MFAERSWWWLGIVCIAALALSLAPVSRLAINPVNVTIEGDLVTMHRLFPGDTFGLQRPLISYVESVKGLSAGWNDGHACNDAAGPFRYSSKETTGDWRIPWAADCLNDPRGFVWEACWRWHVGAFKFGAVCKEHTVLRTAYEVTE